MHHTHTHILICTQQRDGDSGGHMIYKTYTFIVASTAAATIRLRKI